MEIMGRVFFFSFEHPTVNTIVQPLFNKYYNEKDYVGVE